MAQTTVEFQLRYDRIEIEVNDDCDYQVNAIFALNESAPIFGQTELYFPVFKVHILISRVTDDLTLFYWELIIDKKVDYQAIGDLVTYVDEVVYEDGEPFTDSMKLLAHIKQIAESFFNPEIECPIKLRRH